MNPIRWKVFQCLLLEGENTPSKILKDEKILRDARNMIVSKECFDAFVQRHNPCSMIVPEDNETMKVTNTVYIIN